MEYQHWLNKELKKAQKRERDQAFNYQTTGNGRYENARRNAEYLGKALLTAIAIEEGRSESNEQAQRMILGFLHNVQGYIQTLPPEKAVKKIQDVIVMHNLRYGWHDDTN